MGKAQVVDYQVFSLNGENYSLCIIFLSFLKYFSSIGNKHTCIPPIAIMIFVTCFMHVCLTIKYYKIMGGDKIVLLDGAGANGGGAATNGLLSMIPGMFANLIGGNKMDPNLVAALMNGRNNQDGFGGANGWWLWIIVLFWLWGGRGFGNGFGMVVIVAPMVYPLS